MLDNLTVGHHNPVGGDMPPPEQVSVGLLGYTSFNRYFFSQIDKEAAVIDERFNGGRGAIRNLKIQPRQ